MQKYINNTYIYKIEFLNVCFDEVTAMVSTS